MKKSIFVGYDSRWPLAYAVTVRSLLEQARGLLSMHDIHPLLLPHLTALGLYDRNTTIDKGQMFDEISGAPMSTEFAISRFLVPFIAGKSGWSLFCDSDFLFRADVLDLFALADEKYAVMCVKHVHAPPESSKMDGQMQTLYKRKNWSSLMLINNAHPANNALDLKALRERPGRDLHAFFWLDDSLIGELPPEWNWLEGHSDDKLNPRAVHYTRGSPDMDGYADAPYADEWRDVAARINLCRDVHGQR